MASLADAKRTGGYKFLGWTLGAAGIDYITSIPSSSTGDVVLYANWEAPEKAATPVFTKQPADAVYEQGAATTALTIEASSTDELPLSYQWYSNAANSTTGGTAITGATEASYVPSAAAAGTTYYYCVVINTNSAATVTKVASATSSAAKVVVNEKQVNAVAPAITLQPANAVYTAGDAAKALTGSRKRGRRRQLKLSVV